MIGLRPQMSSVASGVVLLLAVTAMFPAPAVDHVQVRVRQTPGGPRIFVDGEPTPPHMFWGREIVAPQRVTGNEVFFGSIEMPREFLAALVRRAGVFVSLEHPERATLWRADGSLALQAMADGDQTLRFPIPTTVEDGLTGEILGKDVTRLPIILRKGEVRVFIFPLAQRTPFWHD